MAANSNTIFKNFKWDEETIARAAKMWAEDVPATLIAKRLGTTRGAIVGKAGRNRKQFPSRRAAYVTAKIVQDRSSQEFRDFNESELSFIIENYQDAYPRPLLTKVMEMMNEKLGEDWNTYCFNRARARALSFGKLASNRKRVGRTVIGGQRYCPVCDEPCEALACEKHVRAVHIRDMSPVEHNKNPKRQFQGASHD